MLNYSKFIDAYGIKIFIVSSHIISCHVMSCHDMLDISPHYITFVPREFHVIPSV